MTEKKTDLRVQKTRHAIRQAFKDMICENATDKITVKAIAQRANIHRKTFYLHYNSIEALYEDILHDLEESYYQMIDRIPVDADFSQANRVFFEFVTSQDEYAEKMICDPKYREFSDKLFLSTLSHNRHRHNPYANYSVEEQSIINNFLSLTSNNLYRQWVSDGKKLPVERLIALSSRLFTQGIHGLDLKNGKY